MVEMEALNAKLGAYSKDPQDSLDLSGMGIGAEAVTTVAAFLPKW
jgi:hypothetical protein